MGTGWDVIVLLAFNIVLDLCRLLLSGGLSMDYWKFLFFQQCKEGQDVHPEQIKAVLLDSAGFHGMM